MHVAAADPVAVSAEQLDPDADRARARHLRRAGQGRRGKSAEIVAKMVEGRLRKEFFQQVVLMEQVFLSAATTARRPSRRC